MNGQNVTDSTEQMEHKWYDNVFWMEFRWGFLQANNFFFKKVPDQIWFHLWTYGYHDKTYRSLLYCVGEVAIEKIGPPPVAKKNLVCLVSSCSNSNQTISGSTIPNSNLLSDERTIWKFNSDSESPKILPSTPRITFNPWKNLASQSSRRYLK